MASSSTGRRKRWSACSRPSTSQKAKRTRRSTAWTRRLPPWELPEMPKGPAARRTRPLAIARAEQKHATALYALITANLEEGRLLPRTLEEVALHASRFSIVLRGRTIVGCAELAPLSAHVAEVRSLAVD